MHPSSKVQLSEQLKHMQELGTTMSMLFMTVRTTRDGMLAGVVERELKLDYPRAGFMDFARAGRFLTFCKRNNLNVTKERWGRERVFRASIGFGISKAVELISQCFHEVYGHSGPFALDLQGYGWQPLN